MLSQTFWLCTSNILEYFRSFLFLLLNIFDLYSYFVIEKCFILISCVRNKVLLTYLLTYLLTCLLTYLLTYLLTFLLLLTFTYLLTYLLTDWLTDWPTDWLTDWLRKILGWVWSWPYWSQGEWMNEWMNWADFLWWCKFWKVKNYFNNFWVAGLWSKMGMGL